MGYSNRSRVVDPLDLEVLKRGYEAAWARIEADVLHRIPAQDEELKEALRK